MHLQKFSPFFSCLQAFPASASFPMCRLFALGSRSIGASASATVLPMVIKGWFPLGLTGLIFLLSKGLLRVFCSTTAWKQQFLCTQIFFMVQISYPSVQFSSVAQLCPILCDPMNCSTPGFPVHYQLLEFTQTHVRQVGDDIHPSTLCRSLLLLPPIPPSIRVFSNEPALRIRWTKFWSFSFSNSPSNEYSRLISFRIDRFELLAVQRTLRSLL